jgi:protein-S-isoprenylcysteine O-methyltransferase Ste14
MRSWTPQSLYEAKPWLLMIVGALLLIGMMTWSVVVGSWSFTRSMLCLLGAALAITGGATLQLRQDYRAKSKWRRDGTP